MVLFRATFYILNMPFLIAHIRSACAFPDIRITYQSFGRLIDLSLDAIVARQFGWDGLTVTQGINSRMRDALPSIPRERLDVLVSYDAEIRWHSMPISSYIDCVVRAFAAVVSVMNSLDALVFDTSGAFAICITR